MSEAPLDHPGVNPETREYWEAARHGKLLLKHCRACGTNHHYPRAICPHCHSADTEWVEASGKGEIYSYSVMRRADPVFSVAYVTLDEGVTIFTNLVETDLDAVKIGDRVTVAFTDGSDGLARPVFKAA